MSLNDSKRKDLLQRLQGIFQEHKMILQNDSFEQCNHEEPCRDISPLQSTNSIKNNCSHTLADLQLILERGLDDSLQKITDQVFDLENQEVIFDNGITGLIMFYRFLKIEFVEEQNQNSVLRWIYNIISLVQSQQLSKIILSAKDIFIKLGLQILNEETMDGLDTEARQQTFKSAVSHLIQQKEEEISDLKFQMCRICESQVQISTLASHIKYCEQTHQLNYYLSKLQQKGNAMLHLINEKGPNSQYIYDMKLFFDRVFNRLGNAVATFALKDQLQEINEVIHQYTKTNSDQIQDIIQLLSNYYNILVKHDIGDTLSDKTSKNQTTPFYKIKISFSSTKSNFSLTEGQLATSSSIINGFINSEKTINTKSQANIPFCNPKLQDFQIISLIGKGAFSEVYLVRKKRTKDLYAMKVIQIENMNEQKINAFKKQQKIYKSIKGCFNIKLYYSFCEDNLYFFILDYACGGNFRSLLEKEVYIEERYAKVYIANLILAVHSIHSMGIVHRDLKPENLVINELGQLVLTDFNLSKLIKDDNSEVGTFFGTPDYIAPEVLKGDTADIMIDWFSVGVIAYEMIIGVTPFTDTDPQSVFHNILNGQIQWPQIGNEEGQISLQSKQLIQSLLNPDPSRRFGSNVKCKADQNLSEIIQEMRKFNFFSNVDLTKLSHCQFLYIPPVVTEHKEDHELYLRILSKKKASDVKSVDKNSVVRFDMLKNVTNKHLRARKSSRFKLQKQLEALKEVTNEWAGTRKYHSFINLNTLHSEIIQASCRDLEQIAQIEDLSDKEIP